MCDLAHHFDNRGDNWEAGLCNCSCGPKGCAPFISACDTAAAVYVLAGPAGAAWGTMWPPLLSITTDHVCQPAYGLIANNRFCEVANFTDAPVYSIINGTVWYSAYVNNQEQCQTLLLH